MNQQLLDAFIAGQIVEGNEVDVDAEERIEPRAAAFSVTREDGIRLERNASANVLALHPEPLVRVGIAAALRRHGGFNVFEEKLDPERWNGSGLDVVVADYHQAMRLADAAKQDGDGSHAPAKILVLTSNNRPADIRRALDAGVHGYVLLGGPLSELIEAVTAGARGSRYLGRSVAQCMVESSDSAALTSREVDVLRLVAEGEPNKSIARRLQIEVVTVKSHLRGILGKLNATSRTHAAAIAFTRGIVAESPPIPIPAGPPRAAAARTRP